MRKIVLLITMLAFCGVWAYAGDYPDAIQSLLDKESSGAQLTPAEKGQVVDYFTNNPTISPFLDTEWGPDGFYEAADQYSGGQPFNWIDIRATGTELWPSQNQDDTWSPAIDLPFTFPYYNTTRDSIKISANVIICFTNQTTPSYSLAIPSNTGHMKIDPWCYDMYHLGADTVFRGSSYYYQAFGDSLFVVQFEQARYYNTTYRYNAEYGKDLEVLLYSDGRIVFQYDSLRSIVAGSPNNSGVEDSVGTCGLTCGNSFSQGYAVTFTRQTGVILANGTVSPLTGNTSTTFNYSLFYRDTNGFPPTASVYIDGMAYGMTDPTGGLGPYTNGVTLTYSTTLAAGVHNYYFHCLSGGGEYFYPAVGSLPGPTVYSPFSGNYDIGGGFNDFPDIISAVDALSGAGMAGPVTFNVYSGRYYGQITIPTTIGSAATPLIIQAAPGENPRIVNMEGTTSSTGCGFRINGAEYITIKGMDIDSSGYSGIYVYYGSATSDSAKYIIIEDNYIHNIGPTVNGYAVYNYYGVNGTIRNNEIWGDYYGGVYLSSCKYYNVYNNMLYGQTYYGMYFSSGGWHNIYHNSVYIASDVSATNYGVYMSSQNTTTFKNNIVYSAGTASTTKYAIYISGTLSTYPVYSDYNCIYAPSNSFGYYTAARANLAAWQTATALDMNSISADPMYVDITNLPNNLHIVTNIPSPVNNVGTPIALVTTDFDGEPRNSETPDLGCDEFTPVMANYNVMVMPAAQSSSVYQGGIAYYYYYVKNVGGTIDTYNLSITGAVWETLLYDSAGMFPITSIGPVAPDDSAWVMVGHIVPTGAITGSSDTGTLVATSVGSPAVSANAAFTTWVAFGGAYDIGGGAMHYATIVEAVDLMMTAGMGGPVTFNVYPGVYDGQVLINNTLSGLSAANPLIFQGVQGMAAPQVINTTGSTSALGNGFSIVAADYITIRGFEIYNCYYSGIDVYYAGSDSSCYLTIENNYIHDIGASGSYYGMYIYRTKYSEIRNNIVQGDYYGIYAGYCTGVKLYNNILYGQDYYGFRIYYGSDMELYYNSVYMNSTYSTTNYATYVYYVTNATLKNNISFNEGSGSTTKYAIYLGGTLTTYPVVSDNNCWYAPNSSLGYYTAARATLADWQTATGLDANSISADPLYLSTAAPYNLHINTGMTSPVNAMAVPIGNIPFDIDGDTRDLVTPDMGADEFTSTVVSYGCMVTPDALTGADTTGNTVSYNYYIHNTGTVVDSYNLWTSTAAWPVTIYDATGAMVISSVNNIAVGDSIGIIVEHCVPELPLTVFSDQGYIAAASITEPTAVDSSTFTTDAIVWPPVQLSLIPDSTNIVIPAGGGFFTYFGELRNYSQTDDYNIRIWKDIVLPSGATLDLWGATLNMPANTTLTRNCTQWIPAGAPAGIYNYRGFIADLDTWEIWDTEEFPFEKLAADGSSNHNNGWLYQGWNDGSVAGYTLPENYCLHANFPNPFNPVTNIIYDLPQTGMVSLVVYDITGRQVAELVDGYRSAGTHQIVFDASQMSSGVYFAVMHAGNYSKTQKMLLVK